MGGILTDYVPPSEQNIAVDELRASRISDTILKAIILRKEWFHAVKDVRYNRENGAILVILYPAANEIVKDILSIVAEVPGVKNIYDNVLEGDIYQGEKFHVLKVVITPEGIDTKQDQAKDAAGSVGTGGAKQVGLVQSFSDALKKSSEKTASKGV